MLKMINRINELTYKGLKKDQKDITNLFPTFYQRVKKVAQNGGVKLVDMTPNNWHFKINSGTEKGKKYDAYIHWKTLPAKIRKYGVSKGLWTKDKSRVDLNKLSQKILFDTDLEIVCSCPADLYWGGHYIRTQSKSKYTNPENRPPNIRNPRQHGAYCKHLELLMSVLPMYVATLAKYMKDYFSEDIENLEKNLGMARKQDKVDKKKDKEDEKDKKKDLKKEKPEEPRAKKKEKPEPERAKKKEEPEEEPEEEEEKDEDVEESVGAVREYDPEKDWFKVNMIVRNKKSNLRWEIWGITNDDVSIMNYETIRATSKRIPIETFRRNWEPAHKPKETTESRVIGELLQSYSGRRRYAS